MPATIEGPKNIRHKSVNMLLPSIVFKTIWPKYSYLINTWKNTLVWWHINFPRNFDTFSCYFIFTLLLSGGERCWVETSSDLNHLEMNQKMEREYRARLFSVSQNTIKGEKIWALGKVMISISIIKHRLSPSCDFRYNLKDLI